MKKSFLAALLTLILSINTALSQTSVDILSGDTIRTITTAVPFLLIAPDGRAGGMAETGVALSPDVNSIHWNTAKLSFIEKDYAFATSYTPWLRNIIDDMSLSYLAGYKKVSERAVITGSLLYFDLGDITITDNQGVEYSTINPKEYALTAGYSMKLSEKLGVGVNTKFINSNLTQSFDIPGSGIQTRPGRTAAADFSVYRKSDLVISGKPATLALAGTMSNVGAKLAYTNSRASDARDFLPANLKLGGALKTEIDQFQSFTFALDMNKYLVPSPPVYDKTQRNDDGTYVIVMGNDPNKSVPAAIFGSFTDAPGEPEVDENGNAVLDSDGNAVAKKGSIFREELREIMISGGVEYWYRDMLAFRGGYFKEHPTKGNREFLTFGFGVRYNFLGVDVSYLASLRQNNPLANTLRFTLMFNFDNEDVVKVPSEETN